MMLFHFCPFSSLSSLVSLLQPLFSSSLSLPTTTHAPLFSRLSLCRRQPTPTTTHAGLSTSRRRSRPQALATMALLSRGRIISSALYGKLVHHPPIHRPFSSSSNAYNQKSHGPQSGEKASLMMNNNPMFSLDISSQVGSCMPISMMRIGTIIHNIEMNPGQGGKLVRAAGTSAKILKEPAASKLCLIRLPSGVEKLIDSSCRATIGVVSNPEHATKKLRKAGQSRWLGRRPVVRGVAMNPVDHPHGGGEGKSKSSGCRGGVSKTPWGKPTKSGFKTGPLKRRK